MPKRSSVTPATTPNSRVPCAVVTRSAMSGANRLCIARGVLSNLIFHSSFELPTLAGVKIFSSFTQPVRSASTPSVRKSEANPVPPAQISRTASTCRIRIQCSLFGVGESALLRQLLQPDVPGEQLAGRFDLEADDPTTLRFRGIFIDQDRDDVSVEDVRHLVADRDDVEL